MKRYIDADKLIEHLKDEIEGCTQPVGSRPNGKSIAYGTELGLKMAISYAETLATADVVEVVRCNECERAKPMNDCEQHYFPKADLICSCDYKPVKNNDFCIWGERKNNNGKQQ